MVPGERFDSGDTDTLAQADIARILLIDDDRELTRLLIEYLRSHGYAASAAHDGDEGIQRAATASWDLIVLDVMMPRLDGFQVLKQLREVSSVPVLMLTARGGDADRVSGLEGGADDYVPKTSSSRELLARIRALLRRAALQPAPAAPREFAVGALRIDSEARCATRAGVELALTPVEFDLLLALARGDGKACSREQLLDQVRDRSFDGADRSIDMHIAALRRKLGDDPKTPRYIRTVRTVGYRLVAGDAP